MAHACRRAPDHFARHLEEPPGTAPAALARTARHPPSLLEEDVGTGQFGQRNVEDTLDLAGLGVSAGRRSTVANTSMLSTVANTGMIGTPTPSS